VSEIAPHILLVEDSPTQALQLRRMLERQGFLVEQAESGESALTMMDRAIPDLVLADYHLPGMNGGQMARQFRMNPATRSIPVLMLTEDAAPGLEREGLESGADAYISKSAHPDLLVLRIRALLRDGSDLIAEEAGRFRRARIVIVTGASEERVFDDEAADDVGDLPETHETSLGELLWRDGHTVTTIEASDDLTEGAWLSGDDGPDCLVIDLSHAHREEDRLRALRHDVGFCRRLDARRQDILDAGGIPFRMLGIIDAGSFRQESSADLFEAGLDDLVPSDIARDTLALRIRVMVRRKLIQDESRQAEIERQVREVALQTAQSEAQAIAAKAALAEALAQANAELGTTNARLIETQAKLVQTAKMASLGELVAGIAHEINNPLAFTLAHEGTVTRSLDRLRRLEGTDGAPAGTDDRMRAERLALLDRAEARIGSMRLGLQRIQNLVLSLRRFSRLDEGAFQEVDVPESIETALALLAHKIGGEIAVSRTLDAPAMLFCQPALLNQVVMNIIANAIDALLGREDGRHGGHIAIRSWLTPADGQARMPSGDGEARYVISISDDGPGIPADIRARIFEPFFTTKPVGSGTGLGLAIAYGVVEAHAGQIVVDDAPEGGARFTLSVPVMLTREGASVARQANRQSEEMTA
jgi:two-component system, NtrC family, sensor kinase